MPCTWFEHLSRKKSTINHVLTINPPWYLEEWTVVMLSTFSSIHINIYMIYRSTSVHNHSISRSIYIICTAKITKTWIFSRFLHFKTRLLYIWKEYQLPNITYAGVCVCTGKLLGVILTEITINNQCKHLVITTTECTIVDLHLLL